MCVDNLQLEAATGDDNANNEDDMLTTGSIWEDDQTSPLSGWKCAAGTLSPVTTCTRHPRRIISEYWAWAVTYCTFYFSVKLKSLTRQSIIMHQNTSTNTAKHNRTVSTMPSRLPQLHPGIMTSLIIHMYAPKDMVLIHWSRYRIVLGPILAIIAEHLKQCSGKTELLHLWAASQEESS